jgi:hypothetical protein
MCFELVVSLGIYVADPLLVDNTADIIGGTLMLHWRDGSCLFTWERLE